MTIYFLILCIVITILFLLSTFLQENKDNPERFKFKNVSLLLQTVFIFITLGFSLYTIHSSAKANSEFKNLISGLIDSSTEIESSIKTFKSSLDSMPASIGKLRDELDTLSIILNKQSQILQDQKSLQQNEFNRKPKLSLEINKCEKIGENLAINEWTCRNTGNISANVSSIIFSIKSEELISVDQNKATFVREKGDYKTIQYNLNESVVSNSAMWFPFDMTFKSSKTKISYTIYYESKNEDGIKRSYVKRKACK